MKYWTPAKTITPLDENSIDEVYDRLSAAVAKLRGFKVYSAKSEYPTLEHSVRVVP